MQKKKIISWLLVIIWMGVIFYLSNMNNTESNTKSKNTINTILEKTNKYSTKQERIEVTSKINSPLRKSAHATVYFILAILIYHALVISNSKFPLKKIIIITISLCILYSISDEYHQTKVKGRSGELRDIIIDTTGAILGITLSIPIFKNNKS